VSWLADGRAGLLARFEMLRDGKMPLTYLNGMNSTLHFLSTWHQESGAKKFTQQFDTANPRMRFADYHLAHVISAYGCSGSTIMLLWSWTDAVCTFFSSGMNALVIGSFLVER
jgi:predicted NodU family carbamoyl transferase